MHTLYPNAAHAPPPLSREGHAGADPDGGIDIQHGVVEVERRLAPEAHALRQPQGVTGPFREIDHAAVRDGDALGHALILAALSTFIQLPLALIIALKLSKGIRGERAYLSIYFMPVLISTVIIGRLWMNIYDPGQAGLLNAGLRALGIDKWLFPAITNGITSSKLPFTGQWTGFRETALLAAFIPILWQYVGYHMLLMYAGIKGVPADLLEAAQLDGCTEGQVNRFIIIPYIKPILKVCVIFAVTGSLKSFDLVYALMKDTSRAELPSTLMYKLLFLHQRYGLGSAVAVVLIILCFLFAVLISLAFRDKGAKVA